VPYCLLHYRLGFLKDRIMPALPAKGLDRFVDTLTWPKAIRDAEREHKARHAKRNAKLDQPQPYQPLKPPRQISYLHYMERGLSLMLVISYGGTKSWRALTYRDGKPYYWKLGTYPQTTVKEARLKAAEYFKNPQKVEDAFEVGTFKEVAEKWFKQKVERGGLRTAYEIRRQLHKYVYPQWGSKKFLDIRRRTVNDLLDKIEEDNGATMANYVLATVSSIMVWWQARDENYSSPIVKGMRKAKSKSRDRILSENEIRRVWQAADDFGSYGGLIKMLLLTAQRRAKVKTMRWDDVSDGVWTIRTAAREKENARQLKLPQMALDVLAAQPRLAGNPYVFPGSLKGRRPKKDTPKQERPTGPATLNSFSGHKAELDAVLDDLPRWTLHDLRRTARSLMAEAGVSRDTAERVLGHALPGVEGTYDRYAYAAEKAEALQRLAAKIASILNPPPSHVVALPVAPQRPRRPHAG
jgi:integrase